MDRQLLRRFLEVYPFQPATAVWRASEVAALSRVTFPAGRGLDLGCGDGRLTQVLSELVGPLHLVGLDVDRMETALAESERFYEAVHTSSADRIPEPDRSFDYVVSISVMEHIGPLEAVLREVARVLKTGGRLITTIPSIGFHQVLRGPLLTSSGRGEYLSALDRRLAHLRYWSVQQWREALDAAGLRLIEAKPILSREEVRRWEAISRLTAGVLHAVSRGKPPIEIQRSLGLRRSGQRLPGPVASTLSRVLAAALPDAEPADERNSGCLLVIAARP
jgi:SAM-dependent methyltransferase